MQKFGRVILSGILLIHICSVQTVQAGGPGNPGSPTAGLSFQVGSVSGQGNLVSASGSLSIPHGTTAMGYARISNGAGYVDEFGLDLTFVNTVNGMDVYTVKGSIENVPSGMFVGYGIYYVTYPDGTVQTIQTPNQYFNVP